MTLMDPAEPGADECKHLDTNGVQIVHVTPLTAAYVTVCTVAGVPGYTFFYVRMVCGLVYLLFRPPYAAEAFIAAGYPHREFEEVPSEVAECHRQEFGCDPIMPGELDALGAELAGLATAEDGE